MSLLAIRQFGKTGLKIFLLGIGTTWFGRQWPPGNPYYTYPAFEEIDAYLDEVFSRIEDEKAAIMIDTAAAYGTSEKRIAEYFTKKQQLLPKSFIATKWGEEFDVSTGTSALNHSKKNLIASVKKSLSYLRKIDLLYIHRTSVEVLRDREIIDEMEKLKKQRYGQINYIGASISDEFVLSTAVKENLIGWLDAIQIPAFLFLKRADLINEVRKKQVSIVLNSPVRKCKDKSPKDIYDDLIKHEEISAILIGTRRHLIETIGYFSKSK